jgi:curved DNA-binding protein CbpA
MTPTHYEVLGIAVDADEAEVRAAFRMRARALHPDAGGDADDMRAVNEAWHVLGNPRRRAAYNVEIGHAPLRHRDDHAIPDDEPELWADLVAAAMTEDPPAASRPSDLITLVPPALFALAIVSFAIGVAIGSAPLLAVFLGALFASGAGFLLAPFFAMTRARRR